MATAVVPAVAGVAAVGAYLNAKYHIAKDIRSIYNIKTNERKLIYAVRNDKVALWPYFETSVMRMPDNEEAIWSREGCYTWKEMYAQSNRYSQFLLSLGFKSRELVGFYLTNSPEFLMAVLGTWGLGSAPAMINYHLAGEALVHCLRVSGAKLLLVDWDDECRARIEDVRSQLEGDLGIRIVILDAATKAHINNLEPIRPPDELRSGMAPDYPMALIYTSGSTGHPKAISFSVGRTLAMIPKKKENGIGVRRGPNGDRYYNCMPMYHGTGGTVAFGCMLAGTTLCIGKKFSTSKFWDDVIDSRSTAMVYVGETARYLLSVPPSPQDKENQIRIAFGNGLRPDVWKRFQDRFGIETIAEFFNSTEGVFGLINLCRGPYLQTAVGHHGLLLRMMMRNYYATAEVDLETGDLHRDPKTGFGNRTPLEKGGEVIVQVPTESLFPGYWNNKSATDKKFTRDLFKKGDLWYRTGDALRRTPDGLWFFQDRLGDTYRWKSENVATMEVAQVLGHFPGVSEAAVYGVEVPGHDGRAGCAAIQLDANQAATPEFFSALLKYATEQLPKYAVPVFVRIAKLDPMHNNKQNKIPLKKDGINLDAIYGVGKDAVDAREAGGDVVYWWPSALGHPNPGLDGERYLTLSRADWEGIRGKTEMSSKL